MYEDILVSVIMAVHNEKEGYLKESIASILGQSHENIEFIIIDDCSNKNVQNILGEIKDKRVRIYRNQENQGLTRNLNIALSYCNGKYIARMDADDISFKDRIKKQLIFMETHRQVGIIGCWTSNNIDKKIKHWYGKTSTEWRKVAMIFGNYGICHPSAFIRKEVLDENSITYDENLKKAQDYDLWTQLIGVTNMGVVSECLLKYRIHNQQITNINQEEQLAYRDEIQKRYIEKILNVEDNIKNAIISVNYNSITIKEVWNAFEVIEKENIVNGCELDAKILKRELTRQWTENCLKKTDNKRFTIFNKYFVRAFAPSYILWRVQLYWQMKIV